MEQIEQAVSLSLAQKAEIQKLEEICKKQDDIRLSYPLEEDEASYHYLLWKGQDRQLISVLAFVSYDEGTAECIGFTHPQYRGQGYFERLLDQVLEAHEDVDILFPVSGSCKDTLAALQALGAEEESREYQMQRDLMTEAYMPAEIDAQEEIDIQAEIDWQTKINTQTEIDTPAVMCIQEDGKAQISEAEGKRFVFYPWGPGKEAAGELQVIWISDHQVCFHHVEIYPRFQGRGLGTEMIRLLLEDLIREGAKTVVLQVSADNIPALRLYEKTGFRITETLSYYLF